MDKAAMLFFVSICLSARAVASQADLQQLSSMQSQLDPLNDPETNNSSTKDQDKRTIFGPTIYNHAWAKHVSIGPSGTKKVIGYGPVDTKFTPALRPVLVNHHGHHFHIKKPIGVLHTDWKPIERPIVPVHIPAPPTIVSRPVHLDHVHVNHVHKVPVHHVDYGLTQVDHVHKYPVPHVDHLHTVPAHIGHVHPAPAHVDHISSIPHVDQIHEGPAHGSHVHHGHGEHVHFIPRPVQQVPVQSPAHYFEVTRPDLGVLPLGAVFSSPVLKEVPAPHLHPVLAPHPVQHLPVGHLHPVGHVHPIHQVPVHTVPHLHHEPHVHQIPQIFPEQHVHAGPHFYPKLHVHHPGEHIHSVEHVHGHPIHPLPVPHVHPEEHAHPTPHLHPVSHIHPSHALSPHAYPAVEYHGVNLLKGQLPGFPQFPVNTVLPQPPLASHSPALPHSPILPDHFHMHYPQIPQNIQSTEHHDSHIPVRPPAGVNVFPSHQQLPLDNQPHFNGARHNVFQQNLPSSESHLPKGESDGAPRYQPADQVSSQHFHLGQDNHDGQGYVYPRPQHSGLSIQPGQTDVQFPLHLPHHPGFDGIGRHFEETSLQDSAPSETAFKPSMQLEPPFRKK